MFLVSACLVGFRCRYDAKICLDESLAALVREGKAIPICPEMLGGLPCPRIPCERTETGSVMDRNGVDRTDAFETGARETLRIARLYGCDRAILKARSPSCGKDCIYDGTFSGVLTKRTGVTAELLERSGITVEVIE